ncbi:MAG: GNAT family N-acetyltransferase [Clostridiales bacterium]|jgi:ribosomal protein S18 acetylase RimI-like enzyme|nr:GNAT family N-acetyltransferase [Clostridiales bacterium]
MNITYNDKLKDLPIEPLHALFVAVGWPPDEPLPDELRKGFMQSWLHSTLVISAWDGENLVGAVRVLSDTIFRSIIYDLLVDPEYHGNGIGSELVRRCKAHFLDSECWWDVTEKTARFIRSLDFPKHQRQANF